MCGSAANVVALFRTETRPSGKRRSGFGLGELRRPAPKRERKEAAKTSDRTGQAAGPSDATDARTR